MYIISILMTILFSNNYQFTECFKQEYIRESTFRPQVSTRTRENNILKAYSICRGKFGDDVGNGYTR